MTKTAGRVTREKVERYKESLHAGKAEWQKKQEGRLDSLVKRRKVEKVWNKEVRLVRWNQKCGWII
jgi:hypothetical protein